MELDITDFFLGCDNPQQYSASVAEYGARARQITWANACRASRRHPILCTYAEFEAARRYFKSFGAWAESAIAAMPLEELNALLIQDIAASMREGGLKSDATQDDWDDYYDQASEGQASGNLFKSDDGRIYYTIEG